MQIRTRLLTLSATALLLTACGREVIEPPLPPAVTSTQAAAAMPPPGAARDSDTSVPSAASVFASDAPASSAATASTRTNATLTDAQESTAMPMAGQADSHSAPKATDQSASSP